LTETSAVLCHSLQITVNVQYASSCSVMNLFCNLYITLSLLCV